MINVSFSRDSESRAITMKLKGHAGQDSKGRDIVCASASILAYTVAQTLKYIYAQGGLKKKPHLILNDGNALISCHPTDEFEGEVLHTFFVAEVGYSLLASNYPQYVGLKMFGEAVKP